MYECRVCRGAPTDFWRVPDQGDTPNDYGRIPADSERKVLVVVNPRMVVSPAPKVIIVISLGSVGR